MTISAHHAHASAKEDAHLLATIRGMRVDLAIKDKAMQRLTRELEECKKTIKKLQREKDGEHVNMTLVYICNCSVRIHNGECAARAGVQ